MLPDNGQLGYNERMTIYEKGIAKNPSGGILWNMRKNGNPELYIQDPRNSTKYSDEAFKTVVAHEIGHSLGLWDAYAEANLYQQLKENTEILNESIMFQKDTRFEDVVVTGNDIEMILQAFRKNKQQHYFDSFPYKKSEVVRCPQEFE